MTALITELKTRARLRLNAARRNAGETTPADIKLRDCLNAVAREVGFTGWEHGRRVLGGQAAGNEDMGSFWHAPACHSLLNLWFARHGDAVAAMAVTRGTYLLPYRRQFMVVRDDFIREIGLGPADPAWSGVQRDLAQAYGSEAWEALAFRRLKAPRSSFASR
jgi:hypothetical protein